MNENPNWHEATADAVDNEWLDAIGQGWNARTGKHWETRDGETREEGLSANVGVLFDEMDEWRERAEKAEAELAEWRKCTTDSNATRINILAGRIALTRDDALHIAGAQDYDAVKAEAAAHRQALEAIRLLTLDPWQMGVAANVRGLCNEALNRKP